MNARRHVALNQLDHFNPAARNKVKAHAVYDTVTYGNAGHENIVFFRTPEGQDGKTWEDTNLSTASQLQSNQAMLVTGVQVLFTSGVVAGRSGVNVTPQIVNDMAAFYGRGRLVIKVGSDPVLEDGPMSLFPGDTRLIADVTMQDDFTADDNKAAVVELVTLAGKAYELEPFLWKGGNNIEARIEYPNGKLALPSGVDGKVRLRLIGSKYEIK